MRFCTAAGSGEAGPPCPHGRAASCRSHRAGVPNPNPNPIPIPNPYPTPNPSPAPKPSPKPYPTFVLLAARIRWRWSRRPWTRSWSRSRSQKRRRRSGRALPSPPRSWRTPTKRASFSPDSAATAFLLAALPGRPLRMLQKVNRGARTMRPRSRLLRWMVPSGVLLLAGCGLQTCPLAYAAYDCGNFITNRECLNNMNDDNVDVVHSGITTEDECRAACELCTKFGLIRRPLFTRAPGCGRGELSAFQRSSVQVGCFSSSIGPEPTGAGQPVLGMV